MLDNSLEKIHQMNYGLKVMNLLNANLAKMACLLFFCIRDKFNFIGQTHRHPLNAL